MSALRKPARQVEVAGGFITFFRPPPRHLRYGRWRALPLFIFPSFLPLLRDGFSFFW
jgi:hypothetical protein